jgi:hypothetical protein
MSNRNNMNMNVSNVSDEEEIPTYTATEKGNVIAGLDVVSLKEPRNARPSVASSGSGQMASRNNYISNFRSSVSRSPQRSSFNTFSTTSAPNVDKIKIEKLQKEID